MACTGQEQEQLIKSLVQEIHVLKSQNVQLMTQVSELKSCMGSPFETSKITFNLGDFLRIPTVNYLSICNLDRVAMELLLNIREGLNYPCAKYLIDCWINGLYKWDDKFMDKQNGSNIQLIHFACKYWCEEAVLYLLDVYEEKNLDLECGDRFEMYPIQLLCSVGTCRIIGRILDIYIGRNLNLERVLSGKDKDKGIWSLLHIVCMKGRDIQIIKYMTNMYIENNYDLGHETNNGCNALHFICRKTGMETIKFMIDVFVEKKIIFERKDVSTFGRLMNSNCKLDANGKKCMDAYLNNVETEIFV